MSKDLTNQETALSWLAIDPFLISYHSWSLQTVIPFTSPISKFDYCWISSVAFHWRLTIRTPIYDSLVTAKPGIEWYPQILRTEDEGSIAAKLGVV